MNESGIYIFTWYQIAIMFLILGILVGYQIGKLTTELKIFFNSVKEFLNKDLASKAKVLYLSNYKRRKK